MSVPGYALLIVGERRSRLAIARGASWERGGQCATTLRAALAASGVDPDRVAYRNLFEELDQQALTDSPEPPLVVDRAMLATVRAAQARGLAIVALGRRVEAALARAGVPCRYLPHPAARGQVRRRELYRALVATVIAETIGEGRDRPPIGSGEPAATEATRVGRTGQRRGGGVR